MSVGKCSAPHTHTFTSRHAYIYTTNSSVYWVTHSGARERTTRVARTGLDCVQMTTRCPWSPACIHTHTQPPARTMHTHSHVPTTSASVTETTTNTNANGCARCPRHTRTGRRDILFLVLIRIPFSTLSGN